MVDGSGGGSGEGAIAIADLDVTDAKENCAKVGNCGWVLGKTELLERGFGIGATA